MLSGNGLFPMPGTGPISATDGIQEAAGMAMHKIQFEYDDLDVMMTVIPDDELFGRTLRAIFTHAVQALEEPPVIGDRIADVFILKECAKTAACAAKHARRQEINRDNAISGHMKQGHQVRQQGQSVNDETAPSKGKKAVENALISKTDFIDLFYSLSKKRLISPDKYQAMKLYNKLLQDGWTRQGKAVESLDQLESILPLLLPYYDDDSDDDVGEENRANGYLFEALLATSPKNASLSDVLNIHADISDTIEFNYATKIYMWTYGDHVYSINRIKELCAQVWADWSKENGEEDST